MKKDFSQMVVYAFEFNDESLWPWFKFMCFYYAIAAYGEFHHLLPWAY